MQVYNAWSYPIYGAATCAFRADIFLSPGAIGPGGFALQLNDATAAFYGDPDPDTSVIHWDQANRVLSAPRRCWVTVSLSMQIDDTTISNKFVVISVSSFGSSNKPQPAPFVQGLAQVNWTGETGGGALIQPVLTTDVPVNLQYGGFVIVAGPLPGAY